MPVLENARWELDERIVELLNERANKVLAKTAREAEVTRDSLLEKLEKAYDVAQKAKNGSAMTMSVIDCGLIIDRREVGDVGAFDHLSDDELVEEAKKRAAKLGLLPPSEVLN
jgi:hypothetical protein